MQNSYTSFTDSFQLLLRAAGRVVLGGPSAIWYFFSADRMRHLMPKRALLFFNRTIVEIIDAPCYPHHPLVAELVGVSDAVNAAVAGFDDKSFGVHPHAIAILVDRSSKLAATRIRVRSQTRRFSLKR